MTWLGVAFVLLQGFSAVVSLLVAGMAVRHRGRPGARTFAALMTATALWAVADAQYFVAVGLETKLVWRTVGYLAHNLVVVGLLAFAVTYADVRGRRARFAVAALAVEPLLVGLVVTPTNALGLHGLVWGDRWLAEVGSFSVIARTFGPWYWVNTAYNYLVVLFAVALFVRVAVAARGTSRRQATALAVGVLPPLAANLLWVTGLTPVDLTPIALAATGLVYAVALFKLRLLDLAPIPRDSVLEHINEGYVVLDGSDRVVDANRAAGDLLGGTPRGGDPIETLNPELADRVEGHRPGASLVTDVAVGEPPRHVEARVSALDAGASTYRLLVLRDVTQRERREEALVRQNERLEEFVSVVSHDLRTPLSVIAGRVELARETGDLAHLQAAERGVDRMEALIDDLLTLARQGREIGETEPVSVGTLAAETWDAAGRDGATLEVVDDPVVEADRGRLRELLENLFSNAREHAGPGVTVEVGGTPGGFYVADDGPGVPREERDLVFTRGVSGSPDGTGFGLSIVEGIAEAHGWSVRVVESAGGGARFELTAATGAGGGSPPD